MFAPCRSELEAYAAWLCGRGMSVDADHLLQEVRLRLRQLEWTYARCMELSAQLDTQARSALPPGSDPTSVLKQVFREQPVRDSNPVHQATLPFQPHDELWVLIESFYYSAHRIRDIFRDNRDALPGLHNFEAIGVRTARNHLIEHTGRTGGVLVPSIACGGPVGPQLRLLRWSRDMPGSHDPGLPANASEFTSQLLSAISRARGAA